MTGVAVLCGGVGAARLLVGLNRVLASADLSAIVNVGDDMELHGLHISPDLDTVVYTVSGQVSSERGWGLEGETWQAMDMVSRYGGADWFSLGDRDLGTHLFRTDQLQAGSSLTEVTRSIAQTWGLDFPLLPVTDDRLRTMLTINEGGQPREISFQEYFVGLKHSVAVEKIRFDGDLDATATPEVIASLQQADRIVIAPSNPAVSIDPLLAVPGVREILTAKRDRVWAVSPIVGGRALKGPADRLLVELGHEASALGVAQWYQGLIGTLVIDTVDAALAAEIEQLGINPIVTETVMSTPEITNELALLVAGSDG